jgi:hypothetical protein
MIFIIFDNYADELGVKTVLAGIFALLLGLLGFVIVSLQPDLGRCSKYRIME